MELYTPIEQGFRLNDLQKIALKKIGIKIARETRDRGLIIRPIGNIVILVPPLSSTKDEIHRMVEIIYESVKLVTCEN